MGNKAMKISDEDLQYLLENTNFNKKQIKEWYKGFMKDCPDGQLSKEAFLDVYAQFFPDGVPDKFCEHVFRSFDRDDSGEIDFREFILAVNITSKGNPTSKLNWAFAMYDIDGNGFIEKCEMLEVIEAIYKMLGNRLPMDTETPEERVDEIFKNMDKNGDGVLSRDEFVGGILKDQMLFQILTADTNAEHLLGNSDDQECIVSHI